MYLRKKGRYWQVVETINGKQKVIMHLGTEEKIVEVYKFYKESIGILDNDKKEGN